MPNLVTTNTDQLISVCAYPGSIIKQFFLEQIFKFLNFVDIVQLLKINILEFCLLNVIYNACESSKIPYFTVIFYMHTYIVNPVYRIAGNFDGGKY